MAANVVMMAAVEVDAAAANDGGRDSGCWSCTAGSSTFVTASGGQVVVLLDGVEESAEVVVLRFWVAILQQSQYY